MFTNRGFNFHPFINTNSVLESLGNVTGLSTCVGWGHRCIQVQVRVIIQPSPSCNYLNITLSHVPWNQGGLVPPWKKLFIYYNSDQPILQAHTGFASHGFDSTLDPFPSKPMPVCAGAGFDSRLPQKTLGFLMPFPINHENIPGPANMPMSGSHERGLCESATLPADAFSPQHPDTSSTKISCNYGDDLWQMLMNHWIRIKLMDIDNYYIYKITLPEGEFLIYLFIVPYHSWGSYLLSYQSIHQIF